MFHRLFSGTFIHVKFILLTVCDEEGLTHFPTVIVLISQI